MLTSARISQGLSASGVRRRAWQAVSRAGRVRSRLEAEGRRGEALTAQGVAGVDLQALRHRRDPKPEEGEDVYFIQESREDTVASQRKEAGEDFKDEAKQR